MGKKNIGNLLVLVSGSMAVVLWWYLITLLGRTEFLSRGTSIGNDVVVIVYCFSLATCILAGYLLFRKDIARPLSILIFILAVVPTAIFFLLNVIGQVG